MTYCRRRAAGTQLDRIQCLHDAWGALRRSLMPLGLKHQIIYQAFWPKALHAVGISLLAEGHVRHLRTQAMKVLGYQGGR